MRVGNVRPLASLEPLQALLRKLKILFFFSAPPFTDLMIKK
jgi:hypothetical protein